MFKISSEEPPEHGNITHWTHIEEMRWFSSNMLSVLAVRKRGFGYALAQICQTFGQQKCHREMTCSKSALKSLLNIVTSLTGPIWKK
jgi:hypothetical protein